MSSTSSVGYNRRESAGERPIQAQGTPGLPVSPSLNPSTHPDISDVSTYLGFAGAAARFTPLDRLPPGQRLLATVIAAAQEDLLLEAIWALPTSIEDDKDVSSAAAGSTAAPTLQLLGENALLLRCLSECVGTCARALGGSYTSSARLLPAALLPLLSRMGDHTTSVGESHCRDPLGRTPGADLRLYPHAASSANTALGSILRHCGFPSLKALVHSNGDYIVDAVCKQLRDLER